MSFGKTTKGFDGGGMGRSPFNRPLSRSGLVGAETLMPGARFKIGDDTRVWRILRRAPDSRPGWIAAPENEPNRRFFVSDVGAVRLVKKGPLPERRTQDRRLHVESMVNGEQPPRPSESLQERSDRLNREIGEAFVSRMRGQN